MKNKQYFFGSYYIYSFFKYYYIVFAILFFTSNSVLALPKCTADINEVGNDSIQSEPTESENKLFVFLKKDEFDKNNICYSSADDYVICDTGRENGNGCITKYACEKGASITCVEENEEISCKCRKGTENSDFVDGKTCEDFNTYVSFESRDSDLKKACYPENHICLKYKDYYKDNQRLYKKGSSNEFYVYKKNMINSGESKNCEFYIFSCDYKIEKESMPNFSGEQHNVVLSGTSKENNKLFVENIFGSLGDMSFFIQAGECNVDSKNCTGNCNKDIDKCSLDAVLKKKYYYKYYDSSKRILYYYEKNIATGKENNIGKICDKYLPNCVDLRPNDSMYVLYNNRNGSSNRLSRREFYKNIFSINGVYLGFLGTVNEANLHYLASSGAINALCLSKDTNSNFDIGYCSDLNEDGSLKYKDGLNLVYFEENNIEEKPNCYLKSCIDLTPEELEAIDKSGNIDKKYCSEYYWLSNTKNLKYFPKEKPVYCSDINEILIQLKFADNKVTSKVCLEPDVESGECKKGKTRIYNGGGGLDREKGNCYIKNCYSLNTLERKLVSNAKIINLAVELERNCQDKDSSCKYESNYNPKNIPIYCDNGFLFNRNTPGYTNFDPINLNVLPCYAFSSEQLNQMNNGKRVLLFTDLIGRDNKHKEANANEKDIKEYDSDSSTIFCRTHYVPLNKIKKASDNNVSNSFLSARIILANEKSEADSNGTYSSKLLAWGFQNYSGDATPEKFNIRYFHDDMSYQKVKFSSRKLDKFDTSSKYPNFLYYIDNVFPYYNADLANMQTANLYNGNEKLTSLISKIKNKNTNFVKCLEEEGEKNVQKDINDKNAPSECKECIGKQDQEKCLYDVKDKKCRDYVSLTYKLLEDSECRECISAKSDELQNECLYNKLGGEKENEKICLKYVSFDYKCKKENCNGGEDDVCNIENFIKDKFLDADFYISKRKETSFLDCPIYLYANGENGDDYKKFAKDIIEDFLEEIEDDKLKIIVEACKDELPIVDERILPSPKIFQQLLKPNKVKINLEVSDLEKKFNSPGKHNLERYGCTNFIDNEEYLGFGYGLYGCRLPDTSSSYFNITFDPVSLYNDSEKVTKVKLDTKENSLVICSRYKNNVFDDKCGQREGSQYTDKCLDFTLGWEGTDLNTLDTSKRDYKWIFDSSTGSSRFRVTRKNRDIYAIRDFHTYHYCSATEEFEGEDLTGFGFVYAAGLSITTAIVLGVCALSCLAAFFLYGVCFTACVSLGIVVGTTAYYLARLDQWNLDLQNDLHIIRGYNEKGDIDSYKNKGLITRALLTDNNDYIYRFYPRADYIEEDLKNKLENNSGYFHENTLGVDILKKCGISLKQTKNVKEGVTVINFGLIELSKTNYNEKTGNDLSYTIKKFDENNKAEKDCNESDIKNCLNEKQKKCIEGYGVRFFDNEFYEEIKENFVLKEGGFLRRYNMGDIAKDDWGSWANPSNKNRDWVPVDIVYNTIDTQSLNELAKNPNCKTGKFGDPVGDFSRCRGFGLDCSSDSSICGIIMRKDDKFEVKREFFTESQALKLPLAGHPFFFYTLVTPKNTPEIFDPSIYVDKFCKYSVNITECSLNGKMTTNNGATKIILNFFVPKIKMNYDYNGGSNTGDFANHFKSGNEFLSYVDSIENKDPNNINYSYSCPYVLKYKSNYLPLEREYIFVLHRTFEKGAHDEYVPNVCLYRIIDAQDDTNTSYNFYLNECAGKSGVYKKDRFFITDNNVMCFPRALMSFEDIILSQSPDINYNRPYINVKIIDRINNVSYRLRQNSEDYNIIEFGENRDLGFGLNFTRSYCSKLYYEYYDYLGQLKEPNNKLSQADINRINKSLNSIETYIKADCDKENGYESEFLVNESEMLSKIDKDIKDNEVVFKETMIVKKYSSTYGGFNEICISDYDIDNMFKLNDEYNRSYNDLGSADATRESSFPDVIAFVDKNPDGVETKCLLNEASRQNKSCMVTDRFVYLYLNKADEENYANNCENGKCKKNIQNCKEEQCKLYININSYEQVPLKKYECIYEDGKINEELTKPISEITEDIAEKIAACYKGGFNYKGIVYDKNNNKEIQCKCETKNNIDNYNSNIFKVREMTPREYGFCVNLEKPIICPAVRYYDASGKYVDDNLALGKTKEEMDKENNQEYYEQHIWRTKEKFVTNKAEEIIGVIPSVFYTKTLGHAEFPASVYCEKDKDCIGGTKEVTGTCLGYWRVDKKAPVAVCKAIKYKNKNVYEYHLKDENVCVRYSCPSIGVLNNKVYLDEFDVERETSNIFEATEVSEFNDIRRTDYRSFINNEEIDVSSVDKRGVSNGFAVWEEIESSDFIVKGKFAGCLTGYNIAGSNYKNSKILLDENSFIKDKVKPILKYCNHGEFNVNDNCTSHEDRKKIYKILCCDIDNINNFCSSNLNSVEFNDSDLPKRYCNQKGIWMQVKDVYNETVLDKNMENNNFYHSGVDDIWLSIFSQNRKDFNLVTDQGENSLIDKVSRYGYCERLVCNSITQLNENYYNSEFFNKGDKSGYQKNIYKFWLHSGGADWKVTSAPRNSSDKLTFDKKGDANITEFSSRDLYNIFSEIDADGDDYVINNKYKYLKKVKGECKKEFGYYNRGTEFTIQDVKAQIANIKNNSNKNILDNNDCSSDKTACKEKCEVLKDGNCNTKCIDDNLNSKKCVDPKKVVNFANSGQNRPYRVCTSAGVWGEITDKCIRSCELLHVYRTNINSTLFLPIKATNVTDRNLKVDNNDILSFNADEYISENYMEGRFIMYNFRDQNLKEENPDGTNASRYTQGEYIFGGADWPRSIIDLSAANIGYDLVDGKYLRYIEVEGSCNNEYSTEILNNPTQYVNSGVDNKGDPIKPRRKCYEDGTWGPVQNRCVLEKACEELKLYVSDVAKLINKYNEKETVLSILNNTLDEIYLEFKRNKKKNEDELFSISSENATAGFKISCNRLICTSTSNNNNASDNETGVVDSVGFNTPELSEGNNIGSTSDLCKEKIAMVCNSSEKTGNYISGWSFSKFALEKYFVPKTCTLNIKRDIDSNDNYFKLNIPDHIMKYFVSEGSDFSEKIDRLNFVFAKYVKDYPINSDVKHYVIESKLDFVYNSMNNIDDKSKFEEKYKIKNSTGSILDENIKKLFYKTINIDGSIGARGGDNKIYYSHEIYATCDNRYFYNEISETDYYNKLAIFHCSNRKFENANGEQLRFIPKYYFNNDEQKNNKYLIKGNDSNSLADACEPKKCGSNSYQNGWSPSYIKEFVDNSNSKKYGVVSKTKFSTLECPNKYAFVIKEVKENARDGIILLGGYENYGFATSLKSVCTGNRSEIAYSNTNEPNEAWENSSFKIINSKEANNSYDANRYGDLQFAGLNLEFCKDIAKTDCRNITEREIINNGNVFKKEYDGNENGYCVRMGCPRLNLRIVNSGGIKKALQSGTAINEIPGTFSLPEKPDRVTDNNDVYGSYYYDFNDVVVIESLDGDYESEGPFCFGRLCFGYPSSPYKDNVYKFVQYTDAGGKKIGDVETDEEDVEADDNLCPTGSDIYNDSDVVEYTYNTYYNETTKDKNKVASCFGNLYDMGSISSVKIDEEYKEVISGKVYVKYNNDYSDKMKIVESVWEDMADYNIDSEKAKVKTNDFLKNSIFDNIKVDDIKKDEVIINTAIPEVLKGYAESHIKDIEEYALIEAEKLHDKSTNTDPKIVYHCFYNIEYPGENNGSVELKEVEELTNESSKFANEEHKLYEYIGEENDLKNNKYIFIEAAGENKPVEFDAPEENVTIKKVNVNKNKEKCKKTIEIDYEVPVKKWVPKKDNDIIKKHCETAENKADCSCDDTGNCSLKNSSKKVTIENKYCSDNIDDYENCEFETSMEDKTLTIDRYGAYYLKLSDFEDEFKSAVGEKINELKNSFDASVDKHALEEKYDEIYSFYKIENYFLAGGDACRIKYYNDFLNEFTENGAQVVLLRAKNVSNTKVFEHVLDFESCKSIKVSDNDSVVFTVPISVGSVSNMSNAIFNEAVYIDNSGESCGIYEPYKKFPTICDKNLITGTAVDNYKKYFMNLFNKLGTCDGLDLSLCNIRNLIKYYYDKYGNNDCANVYEDFLDSKSEGEKGNAGKIKSGLFMIMKCTPEGWIVEGNPSCKYRCSGSKTINVGPNGFGDYDVTIKVSDLRHSKNTGQIQMGAYRSQANCSAGNMHAYKHNGTSFSCDSGTITDTGPLYSGGGSAGNFEYHSHGWAWKVYCSGTFSAFGITTQRKADRSGEVGFPYRDSFCWTDLDYTHIGVLCPGNKNVHQIDDMGKGEGNRRQIDCDNICQEYEEDHDNGDFSDACVGGNSGNGKSRFDTVTSILYDIKRN